MRHSFALADDLVDIRCSTVADGDFHIDVSAAVLAHRRACFTPGRWTQLDEVHGTDVHVVTTPGEHDRAVGDGLVSTARAAVLAVWVGDCAPVVLVSDGVVAAAHAGWRGARDGVLQRTVATMRAVAADPTAPITAHLGPCIRACCYEFGADDLGEMSARYGEGVRGRTSWGGEALDMVAVVRAALDEVGVGVHDLSGCTGCAPGRWFSHRRGERGRQVMTVCRRAAR